MNSPVDSIEHYKSLYWVCAPLLTLLCILCLSMSIVGCNNNSTEYSKTGTTSRDDVNESYNAHTPNQSYNTDGKNYGNTDDRQTLHIATESSYKPLSYIDANGKLIGFEIDLMHALCQQIDRQCKISVQKWNNLIPGLLTKQYDAIIAGMTITPERLKVVDFSMPYYHSALIYIATADDNLSLKNELRGLPIGVQESTVAAQYLMVNQPTADVEQFANHDQAYEALQSGLIRAVLVDKVSGSNWLHSESGQGFEQKGNEISSYDDAIGIAVRKGDPLAVQFNGALQDLQRTGDFDRIAALYFGTPHATANNAATNSNMP